MSMTHCPCCLQTNSAPTCQLCGWKQDTLNERGYSKLNRQTVSKARSAFIRALPDRLDAAIRACRPV
jgi:hypothetical protein